MESNIRTCLIIYCLVLCSGFVSSTSIGSAPGVYDLGIIDPGERITFRYYLMTNSRGDLLVSGNYITVHRSTYFTEKKSPYKFIPSQASEESIADWVEVVKSPVVVSPSSSKLIYLPGGSVVRANGEIDIRLTVPDDAEPGYHAGAISLGPKLSAGGRGTGVSTFAVTRPSFVFQVSGDAVRGGKIINIIADRIGERKADIDVFFQNTGTTTISIKLTSLKIYDKVGNVIADLNSGLTTSSPGDIKTLSVDWSGDKVQPGKYRAEATVSWTTGYTTHVQDIEISEKITYRPSKGKPAVRAEGFPSCDNLLYGIVFLLILSGLAYVVLRDSSNLFHILLALAALIFILAVWYVIQCIPGLSFLDVLLFLIIIGLIIYYLGLK